jgi:exopolysaccharide biosynthesis polyprenyl glycosylphosphotransferase
VALGTLLSAACVQIGRVFVDRREDGLRRDGILVERVLVVADAVGAADVMTLIDEHSTWWQVVGCVGDQPTNGLTGGWNTGGVDLRAEVADRGASVVVVTADALRDEHTYAQLLALRRDGADVRVHAGLRGLDHRDVRVAPLGHDALLYLDHPRLLGCQRFVKRCLDITLAVTVLVLTAPILAAAAVAIKLEDRGPVVFRQMRVGRNGVPFQMPKLRSMEVGAERRASELQHLNERDGGPLFKIDADPRVTRVGRVIRALSIDELPQLCSVVKGEMSLIGPRPALPSEVVQFDERLASRHHVRPGVTGLWQVEQRDNGSFDAYRRLDLYYVENWSLLLDLTILVHTIPAIAGRGWKSLRPRPVAAPLSTPAASVAAPVPGVAVAVGIELPNELMAS